jgi:integrase
MSQSLLATRTTTSEIQIEIDWPLLLEQRSAVLRHTETPAYLLLPEIHQLMDVVRQDNLLLMINTLWHTGARISECLALTPNHFVLDTKQPYVSVETLKSRGRPKRAGRVKPRLVPLCDLQFIRQLERYVASHHIRKNQLLFPITRSAANKRFDRLVANMTHKPSIKITPHTFRHSFAVNAIFHGTPLPVLQGWLGHADINSTLVYTQVLSLETYHLMQRIQY